MALCKEDEVMRKIIQLQSYMVPDVCIGGEIPAYSIVVLCDDGTIWQTTQAHGNSDSDPIWLEIATFRLDGMDSSCG